MDKNMTDNYEVAKLRSPIGIFVLKNDGNLRISAIQRDPVSGKLFNHYKEFELFILNTSLDCGVFNFHPIFGPC